MAIGTKVYQTQMAVINNIVITVDTLPDKIKKPIDHNELSVISILSLPFQ